MVGEREDSGGAKLVGRVVRVVRKWGVSEMECDSNKTRRRQRCGYVELAGSSARLGVG